MANPFVTEELRKIQAAAKGTKGRAARTPTLPALQTLVGAAKGVKGQAPRSPLAIPGGSVGEELQKIVATVKARNLPSKTGKGAAAPKPPATTAKGKTGTVGRGKLGTLGLHMSSILGRRAFPKAAKQVGAVPTAKGLSIEQAVRRRNPAASEANIKEWIKMRAAEARRMARPAVLRGKGTQNLPVTRAEPIIPPRRIITGVERLG